MTMVVITANIDGDTGAFEADIRELLEKHKCEIDFKPNAGALIYIAWPKPADAEPEQPPVNDVPAIELPQEVEVTLATAGEMMADPVNEPMNIPAVELPSLEVPPMAADVPAQPFKDVVLKSLSVACTVPSFIDRTVPASFLRASNVSQTNEFVSFTYCNMSYQFPIQRNSDNPFMVNPTCNANAVYTDTTIRVVVELAPNNVSYPCLLQVIDKGNTIESVTFGQDLAELVSVESEPSSNDQVSA